MTRHRSAFALPFAVFLTFASAAAPPAAEEHRGGPRAGPAPSAALTAEVVAADRAFFAALFFDRCDTTVLAKMVTDDFEMFHDKDGRSSKSGAEFIQSLSRTCERQKQGTDYRARREMVTDGAVAEQVYPLHNYGAVHVGEHRFFQLLPGKPEKLVEISRFAIVWRKDADGWRMARVISYDHRLTN